MQKRNALLAVIALAMLCFAVSPVLASTIKSNDFNEAHWQTYTGYADFSSKGITLVPTYNTNTSKILYYKTVQELGYNTTKVYLYYKISSVEWYNENNMDRTVELFVTNGVTDYLVGFNHYSDRYDFRLKVGSNQVYQTLSEFPTEGIIAFDSATNIAILYATNGTRITQVQYSGSGSTSPLTTWGFTAFKASPTIESYALANTLDSVTMAKNTSNVNSAVMAFIPLIVTFALLGIVLGMIRKF
ncbi:MAG: hypothetical protein ACQXXG_09035 [Candidatus Bathyarchaeia archaeon]